MRIKKSKKTGMFIKMPTFNQWEEQQKGVKMVGQERLDGKKNDEGKIELGLIPGSLLWAIGEILTFGAKKYGEHNWRKGLAWSRPYNALLRHLTVWWAGESLDKESGKSHLWHAATELAFLVEYEGSNTGKDDRFKVETK